MRHGLMRHGSPNRPFAVLVDFFLALGAAAALGACSSDDAALTFDSAEDAGDATNEKTDGHVAADAKVDVSDSAVAERESEADVGPEPEANEGPAASAESIAEASDDRGPTPEAASDARDALLDCTTPGIAHVAPAVPAAIAVPAGVTLFAGYRGVGNQIYVCEPTTSEGGATAAGTWASAPVATLYGGNCAAVITHTFAAGNPAWTAIADGSSVIGRRDGVYLPPRTGGPSPSMPWLRFAAILNGGAGIFTNVTYIQRVDTVGASGHRVRAIPAPTRARSSWFPSRRPTISTSERPRLR
jgi:hypothetical protein